MRTVFFATSLILTSVSFSVGLSADVPSPSRKPNIIFVLADDIAIGELGCYGQTKIETPVLDRIAADGIRFTQGYSGASVCAPSRASLITGLHCGHCPIRANREIVGGEGQKPLPEGTYTVAKLLKSCGYATLCAGKWGMGMFDTSGSPLKMGFDDFYGYNCQRHAHSYFPEYLYDNNRRIPLDGKTYAPDLTVRNTLDWIRRHKNEPFFLFYATTLPHLRYEIDDLGIYKDKVGWSEKQKTYAAMCTRLDTHIGMIIDQLKELELDEDTILFFAGDNGSQFGEDWPISKFFNTNAGFRGNKRTMYEGGLRQAFLVRWPGHVPANTVCDTPIAFWDLLPTCADLAGTVLPNDVSSDGVSILPMILGGRKPDRETFYWELHEKGPSLQAVRWKNWKFVKNSPSGNIELYDLDTDFIESVDLASRHPEMIRKGEELMKTMRSDAPDWPLKD